MLYAIKLKNNSTSIVEARSIKQAREWAEKFPAAWGVPDVHKARQDEIDWVLGTGGKIHKIKTM